MPFWRNFVRTNPEVDDDDLPLAEHRIYSDDGGIRVIVGRYVNSLLNHLPFAHKMSSMSPKARAAQRQRRPAASVVVRRQSARASQRPASAGAQRSGSRSHSPVHSSRGSSPSHPRHQRSGSRSTSPAAQRRRPSSGSVSPHHSPAKAPSNPAPRRRNRRAHRAAQ